MSARQKALTNYKGSFVSAKEKSKKTKATKKIMATKDQPLVLVRHEPVAKLGKSGRVRTDATF